jgi:hypothetical protein
MEIFPLQITSVDWTTYIKVCQDSLGYSPTRGIDDLGIKTSSPAAFLYTLDWNNEPRKAIRNSQLYRHSYMSFISKLTSDEFMDVSCSIGIAKRVKFLGQNYLCVFSATLSDWDYAITRSMIRESGINIRRFLNSIKKHLERAGYNELWTDYEELYLSDSTFVLSHK